MILQCTLTPEGRVTDCRVLKTLPHMEQAVLQAVSTWRYSPVLFQGRPVTVKYNFQIQLVAP
jgi:protein TonB